jgi:tetratricopeptide (TPR) repeat protein
MKRSHERALLYGGAGLVLAWLGSWAFCNRNTEADVTTLLSSADVQLRMAYAMTVPGGPDRQSEIRKKMIADAEGHLANVDRQQPGMACTAEFRGFACMLKGDYRLAADAYAAAQRCSDVDPEQRDVLAFNEARMLGKCGKHEEALAVYAQRAAELDRRFGHQRAIEEAAILRQMGKKPEAEQRLDTVVADGATQPMAWLQAGLEFEQLGRFDRAEAQYVRAAKSIPIGDFHLARLKLRQGDADMAVELLGRAEAAVPAEVRRLVREEPDAWQALAADARFKQLTAPRAATPGR